MIDFETDDLKENQKFWIFVVGFMAISGLVQILLGEHLLGITFLGASVTFATVAHDQLKEDET